MQFPLNESFSKTFVIAESDHNVGFPELWILARNSVTNHWERLRRVTDPVWDEKTRIATFNVPIISSSDICIPGVGAKDGRYQLRGIYNYRTRLIQEGDAFFTGCPDDNGGDDDGGGGDGGGGGGGDSPFGPTDGGDPLPTPPNTPADPCLPTPYSPPPVPVPTPCAGGGGGTGPGGWGNPGTGSGSNTGISGGN